MRSRRTNSRFTTRIEDLAAALRAQARGLYCVEAAAELLIGHERWLYHGVFVDGFVETVRGLVCGTLMAFVDWPGAVAALDAGRLACSASESQVLRVAAGVAGGVPVDLREAVCGLDETNLALVAGAVLHAGGQRRAVVALGGVEDR